MNEPTFTEVSAPSSQVKSNDRNDLHVGRPWITIIYVTLSILTAFLLLDSKTLQVGNLKFAEYLAFYPNKVNSITDIIGLENYVLISFNPLDLILNVIIISYFGYKLEKKYGHVTFFLMIMFILYGTALILSTFSLTPFLAGSGALIFGLFGVKLGQSLTYKEQPFIAIILIIVELLSTELTNISFWQNLSGLICGTLIGVLIYWTHKQRVERSKRYFEETLVRCNLEGITDMKIVEARLQYGADATFIPLPYMVRNWLAVLFTLVVIGLFIVNL